jgi:divalent metal cation (Fe/Co/Zn/Cd) transporter
MLYRIKKSNNENKDDFEKTALTVTGASFYLLTAGLLLGSTINLLSGHKPETTSWGILISLISIFTMWLLIKLKFRVGLKMNSRAIIADANCTKTCMYLSVILLISSLGFQLLGIGLIDSLGAVGISYFSFKEGKEAFEKAKSENHSCGCEKENR